MSTDNKPVKKYKLLKDLPDCAAGTIFTFDGDDSYDYEYTQYKDVKSWYKENVVENNPEWFSPIEEELPSKDKNIDLYFSKHSDEKFYRLYAVGKDFDMIKATKILEQVLNSNNEGDGSGIIRVAEAHWKEIHKLLDKYEKEMGAIIEEKIYAGMENVFNAAREGIKGGYADERNFHGKYYRTFKDYKNSLPENKSLPKDTVKPPLGIIPEWLWKEQRNEELLAAIGRYSKAKLFIPLDWITEQFTLSQWLKNREEEKKESAPKDKVDKPEQVPLEDMPLLSLNDLLKVWEGYKAYNDNYYKSSPMYQRFERKAKQKLSQQ